MNDNPELQKLYQNLDITFAMQQIADRCEELGDLRNAVLWRWVAKKQFYPGKRGNYYYWVNSINAPKTAPHTLDWHIGRYYVPQSGKMFIGVVAGVNFQRHGRKVNV